MNMDYKEVSSAAIYMYDMVRTPTKGWRQFIDEHTTL